MIQFLLLLGTLLVILLVAVLITIRRTDGEYNSYRQALMQKKSEIGGVLVDQGNISNLSLTIEDHNRKIEIIPIVHAWRIRKAKKFAVIYPQGRKEFLSDLENLDSILG